VNPPDFAASPENIAAINDFACRFRDGEGHPSGVGPADACTLFPSGDFAFVNQASTVQFCAQVSRLFAFPEGDTVLTVRLRDVLGNVGPAAQIVVRVLPTPTPPPIPTATPTRPAVEPIGRSGKPVSPRTYQPNLLTFPDLQIWTSRDLGNGSTEVCDRPEARPGATPAIGGGVPATSPLDFALTPENIARVNDFACRFRDGQDQPFGRLDGEQCVLLRSGDYGFASQESQIQFCAMVDAALAFPSGETQITVRLRDVDGNLGPPRTMFVRVL
jgi:hypothetical protein